MIPPTPEAEWSAAFERRVPYHWHSLGLIRLYLELVLSCAVGFRGAAAVLRVTSVLFPTAETAPSPNGGQIWLLRLGLYELTRPKEAADDWVWLIDHTIQIGRTKCLIVAGVRLSQWERKRAEPEHSGALEHHDLTVWMIEPVEKSDGARVHAQLEQLSRQTGVSPKALLSDCGGDVSKGTALYRANHPDTLAVKDFPHAAANAVKHELGADPDWAKFLAAANTAKTKMRQTKFAFLLPPDLKGKARWMNLEPLLVWSRKVLSFVSAPRPVPGVSWEDDELEARMGWIRRYRAALERWSQMLEVVEIGLRYIRKHGYHQNAQRELRVELRAFLADSDTAAARVGESLLRCVDQQSAAIPADGRLLGSTEVLESLIGKTKQLEGQQSKSGFTKTILALAASVSDLAEQTLSAALSAVKVRDVVAWTNERLGVSVQGQRYHAFAAPEGTKPA